MITTLGYADGLGLTELGDDEGLTIMSKRTTAISEGSEADADMKVSIEKTKVLHVREQDPISNTKTKEAIAVCKFVCPHTNCSHVFTTKRGMQIHAGKCKCKDVHIVDAIKDCEGPTDDRKYLVSWEGYTAKDDSWEPRRLLPPLLVKQFELDAGIYDHDWPARCDICDYPCASARGVKIHKSKKHKPNPPQDFSHRLTDKQVKLDKLKAQQEERPKVICAGEPLDNVFTFKYLGSIFTANADQSHDIKARAAMAMARCGQLRHIFDSKHIPLRLKIRLYEAAVCSLLTYGCETGHYTRRPGRPWSMPTAECLPE